LELINHLSGKQGKFLKLEFRNTSDLQEVKKDLVLIVEKNKKTREEQEAYEGMIENNQMANDTK
jgi:hypothetical protein